MVTMQACSRATGPRSDWAFCLEDRSQETRSLGTGSSGRRLRRVVAASLLNASFCRRPSPRNDLELPWGEEFEGQPARTGSIHTVIESDVGFPRSASSGYSAGRRRPAKRACSSGGPATPARVRRGVSSFQRGIRRIGGRLARSTVGRLAEARGVVPAGRPGRPARVRRRREPPFVVLALPLVETEEPATVAAAVFATRQVEPGDDVSQAARALGMDCEEALDWACRQTPWAPESLERVGRLVMEQAAAGARGSRSWKRRPKRSPSIWSPPTKRSACSTGLLRI